MKPLVLFHASCNDGFCAAWVYRRFVNPKCEFRAVQYGWEPPVVDDREVVILDFSYERALLLEMQERATSLLVLDHHQTAAADLEGLDFCVFDLAKSGARLTWEYFFDPQVNASIDIPPWLVDYTEDKDLWRWELSNSRPVNAALESYPRLFHIWDNIAQRTPSDLAVEGKAILRYQDRLIRPRVKNHSWAHIGGFQVPVSNSTSLSSEIGNRMAQGHPFAAVFFILPDGKVVYNLRSSGEDAIDVSEIARQYGGGGHKNAAGFTVDTMIPMEVHPLPELP